MVIYVNAEPTGSLSVPFCSFRRAPVRKHVKTTALSVVMHRPHERSNLSGLWHVRELAGYYRPTRASPVSLSPASSRARFTVVGRSITFPLYESIVSMGSDRTEGACIKAQLPALPPCGRPGFVRKRNQGPVVKFGFRAWTNPKNEARIGQGPVHRQSRKGGRVCLLAQKGRPVRRTAFCIERSPSLLLLFKPTHLRSE